METPQQGATAMCWGCGLEVYLPSAAPSFKCGWCGAITLEKQGHRRDPPSARWYWLRDLATSTFLVILIFFIVGGGVAAIFPVVFPFFSSPGFYFHSLAVLLITFNIFFNFCAALKGPAGVVPPLPFGSTSAAPQGALDDCTFCERCERPKPSKAHHCRACRTCVMGMDHHCPFIANCVGADNQRAFMLLLLYAILGCSYALGMGTWALFKMAPEVVSLARAGQDLFSDGFPTANDVIGLVFSVRVRISVRLIVVGYLTFLSVGVILAAGVLLKQQLDAVFSGETMIDSMQGAPLVSGGEVVVGRVVDDTWQGKLRSLDRVFGRGRNGRRWLWLAPRWPRKHNFSEHKKAG